MLTVQEILNKVFRDQNGQEPPVMLTEQQIFNLLYDEIENALRIKVSIDTPPSLLLKTGQTTSYHAGDDGDLEKGVARDYTVLTTGQYSGTTDITINGKTHALSNECVKDNNTGLMWARYVPNADIGPDNNGKLFWIDATSGEDIWSFVDQANANNLGGHNDWRVPNYFELPSILNFGLYDPSIDTTTFPSTPSDYHWTSTTYPGGSAYAFYVNFNFGNVDNTNKATSKYYVRLVRG